MTELASLSTALSALQAQTAALQTTGNNIANASTPGYSRQRADLSAVSGPTMPSMWSTSTVAGNGVAVNGISRSADQLVQVRVVAAHGQSALLDAQSGTLSSVEDAFGEPSDTGLTETLAGMWSSWSDVADQPTDAGSRTALLQQAGAVADSLNQISGQLSQQWDAQRATLSTSAADLTSSAASVAKLNGQIETATAAGEPTADLADQRDTLIQHMGELGGVTTVAHTDGTIDVLLGGSALVSGTSSRALTVSGTQDFTSAGPGAVTIGWADTGTAATVPGGSLGAAQDAVNNVLPSWRDRADAVAAKVAGTVNAAQAGGYDLGGNAGTPMFTGTTAATIQVAITDPNLVAASSSATATGDGSNALDAAQLATSTTGADAAWQTAIADLGVAAQSATRASTVQTAVTSQVDAAQESVSGVDIDEEMTNMLQYQHAYEAASKFMSTLNETLDSLISMVQ